jgi:hypothetical protein
VIFYHAHIFSLPPYVDNSISFERRDIRAIEIQALNAFITTLPQYRIIGVLQGAWKSIVSFYRKGWKLSISQEVHPAASVDLRRGSLENTHGAESANFEGRAADTLLGGMQGCTNELHRMSTSSGRAIDQHEQQSCISRQANMDDQAESQNSSIGHVRSPQTTSAFQIQHRRIGWSYVSPALTAGSISCQMAQAGTGQYVLSGHDHNVTPQYAMRNVGPRQSNPCEPSRTENDASRQGTSNDSRHQTKRRRYNAYQPENANSTQSYTGPLPTSITESSSAQAGVANPNGQQRALGGTSQMNTQDISLDSRDSPISGNREHVTPYPPLQAPAGPRNMAALSGHVTAIHGPSSEVERAAQLLPGFRESNQPLYQLPEGARTEDHQVDQERSSTKTSGQHIQISSRNIAETSVANERSSLAETQQTLALVPSSVGVAQNTTPYRTWVSDQDPILHNLPSQAGQYNGQFLPNTSSGISAPANAFQEAARHAHVSDCSGYSDVTRAVQGTINDIGFDDINQAIMSFMTDSGDVSLAILDQFYPGDFDTIVGAIEEPAGFHDVSQAVQSYTSDSLFN